MKRTHPPGRYGRRLAITGSTVLTGIFCFLLALWSQPAHSQPGISKTYTFGHDDVITPLKLDTLRNVKHYSTEMVPSPLTPDEQAMAGTIYHDDTGVYSSVHFLRLDDTGKVLTSVDFVSDAPYFDGITFPDDIDYLYRSVDLAATTDGSGNNAYYITCLGQSNNSPFGLGIPLPWPGPSYTYGGQTNRDRIRIIATDDAGNLNGVVDLKDITTLSGFDGYHLEPLNSMVVDMLGGKWLFICGYTYLDHMHASTGGGPIANYVGPKKAFVICVDVTNPLWMTFIKGKTYDTEPLLTPDPASGRTDFDMAMRIKPIKNGFYASDFSTNPNACLFVTGSGNAFTGLSPINRCATLVYLVKLNNGPTLLDLAQDIRILPVGNQDGWGEMEYGFDMIECDDPGAQINHIISNKMPYSPYYSNNYPPDDRYLAMDPKPIGMIITETDQNFQPIGQRTYYKDIWGIQALTSKMIPITFTTYHNFMIAGFRNTNYTFGASTYAASNSDVKPYLFDLSINMFPTPPEPSFINHSFTYYDTWNGTGIPGTDLNNYYGLGSWSNGSCNIYWNPVFAQRGITNDDMVYMATPRWGGKLKMRWIKADGTSAGPKYSDNNCAAQDMVVEEPDLEGYTSKSSPVPEAMDIQHIYPSTAPREFDHRWRICVAGESAKQANTITAVDRLTTMIYPNPATDAVKVQLANSISGDATIKMQLINMQGQVVSNLYEGNADNAGSTHKLPAVAAGLYLVHIYANGVLVHQQKLSINK